jgi:putative hydrolase of the HAD superfamily
VDVAGFWALAAAYVVGRNPEKTAAALLAAERELSVRARERHSSATLAELFSLAGVPHTEQAAAAYLDAWTPHTLLDPLAPRLLTELRERGLRVGLLSNTTWPRERHEAIFARDGVLDLFDGAVYSSEIPWAKPHPEAFRCALRAVGDVPPENAVYVGDRLYEDVYGARVAGLRAILIPHSEVPEKELVAIEDTTPDAVIYRLDDLLAIIDGWNAPGVPVEGVS